MPPPIAGNRYGRFVGALAVLAALAIGVATILTKTKGAAGIQPGGKVPPFAVPLVSGHGKEYEANVSRSYGEAGPKVPAACKVSSAIAVNVCALYERGPVVLALFTDRGSCPDVLRTMEALAPSFPGVSFAAVAIHNARPTTEKLLAADRISFPVGFDSGGVLAGLYRLASCPQVSFIERGGIMQSKALLLTPSQVELRDRVRSLIAASAARTRRLKGAS
ncbi:MAG: hypothetical protein ACYCUM_03405 [Solirubrobacteraceae bacterium]